MSTNQNNQQVELQTEIDQFDFIVLYLIQTVGLRPWLAIELADQIVV